MIRVKVGGREYDVKFYYSKLNIGSQEIPHDSTATIYEKDKPAVVAQGQARLHPNDWGKFRYKFGRKIALKNAVAQTTWSYPEKTEFWAAMMPYIRENG